MRPLQTAALALFLAAPLIAPAAPAFAQGTMAPAPSAHVTFTLTDPSSTGEGLLGRGTLSFHGHDYRFEATGFHMIRTAANAPPSLSGDVFNLAAPADINGQYTSIGNHTSRAYIIQNERGVRMTLEGIGTVRIPPHDKASPITLKLIP